MHTYDIRIVKQTGFCSTDYIRYELSVGGAVYFGDQLADKHLSVVFHNVAWEKGAKGTLTLKPKNGKSFEFDLEPPECLKLYKRCVDRIHVKVMSPTHGLQVRKICFRLKWKTADRRQRHLNTSRG
mmetsp:Transcript_11171/g.12291  ORF Transcript_11171/g.12291 Transcript_11171/m.12291 type:complete len:126 (+) Transcript_11171:166-543(+)